MKVVIASNTRHLVSLSNEELVALANCANEVLHNSTLDERDCHTRLGLDYEKMKSLQRDLGAAVESKKSSEAEVFEAWRDGASIQIRAISAFGDPADLSFEEVRSTIQPILDDEKNAESGSRE